MLPISNGSDATPISATRRGELLASTSLQDHDHLSLDYAAVMALPYKVETVVPPPETTIEPSTACSAAAKIDVGVAKPTERKCAHEGCSATWRNELWLVNDRWLCRQHLPKFTSGIGPVGFYPKS